MRYEVVVSIRIFAADESRWTRKPSSVHPSTRDSVQNKLCKTLCTNNVYLILLLDRVLDAVVP